MIEPDEVIVQLVTAPRGWRLAGVYLQGGERMMWILPIAAFALVRAPDDFDAQDVILPVVVEDNCLAPRRCTSSEEIVGPGEAPNFERLAEAAARAA